MSNLNNSLPVISVKLKNGQIEDLKLPKDLILNDGVYVLNFSGNDHNGELSDGDLLFIDPSQVPVKDDYIAIYPKGSNTPFIEKMALTFMPGSIGEEIHPESNVVAVLSIRRADGLVRTVACSKLDKVHKIVGKAHQHLENRTEVHHA